MSQARSVCLLYAVLLCMALWAGPAHARATQLMMGDHDVNNSAYHIEDSWKSHDIV